MKTSVNLAGVELKNPVMTASGTFGSGAEYSEFVDLKELGAVVTKGVANVPWPGNPTPRIAEVYGGMLNAIGLQNPGIDVFCERDIPFLKQFDTKIVVNVCGRTTEDYCEVVERLTSEPVDLLETLWRFTSLVAMHIFRHSRFGSATRSSRRWTAVAPSSRFLTFMVESGGTIISHIGTSSKPMMETSSGMR